MKLFDMVLKEEHNPNHRVVPYGWTEHTIINTMGFDRYDEIHREVIIWLYDNIENCEKNAHWFRIYDCIYIHLRKPRDAMLFTLRWSNPK